MTAGLPGCQTPRNSNEPLRSVRATSQFVPSQKFRCRHLATWFFLWSGHRGHQIKTTASLPPAGTLGCSVGLGRDGFTRQRSADFKSEQPGLAGTTCFWHRSQQFSGVLESSMPFRYVRAATTAGANGAQLTAPTSLNLNLTAGPGGSEQVDFAVSVECKALPARYRQYRR